MNKTIQIRKIQEKDNLGVCELIKAVMPEFGACGSGFAINDAEVENMALSYSQNRSVYFVVTEGEKILGGGGIAPLKEGADDVCELRKMYFLPELRGQGKGNELLTLCLMHAKQFQYKICYLETLKNMQSAQKLYRSFGFIQLTKPMGSTGHFSCDTWFAKEL